MAVKLPKAPPAPKIQRESIRNWLKGYNSRLDVGRTPTGALVKAYNALLYQDGTVGPRWSLIRYGVAMLGTCIGYPTEFVKVTNSGKENWLISLQVVAGVANVYVSKDGGSWQLCSGKNYDTSARAHFCPGDTFVLVTNGTDNLSYLQLSDFTIKTFNPLPPIGPITAAASASLTSGSTTYPNRYRVAYAKNGITAASTAVQINTNTQRAAWSSGMYIDVTIPVPTPSTGQDAPTRAEIYWGETPGTEFLIATVPMPTTGTTFNWRDTGTDQQDLSHPAPNADTSSGLPATRAAIMFEQVFLFGVKDDLRTVYFGGTTIDSTLDFSAYGGGGSTQVGMGKDLPVNGIAFRDNHGDPSRVIVSKGTNGEGMRYRLTPKTLTQGSTVVNYFQVDEDAAHGTDSPDTLVVYNDALFYLARSGFESTYTKPQVQTILSTDQVSDNIDQDVKTLNVEALESACAKQVDGRLFFSVPNQSPTNNEIWTLDLKRQGGWMLPLDISADWIESYTDNDGYIHTLILQNNTIYEFANTLFNYGVKTLDDGTPFSTYIQSGIINFSDDGADWGNILDVTFVFLRPQGDIVVGIDAYTQENPSVSLASQIVPSSTAYDDSGWGETAWGDEGWGEVIDTIIAAPQAVVPVIVELDEDVKHFQYSVYTSGGGADYQLSDVIVRYVNIGTVDLE